LARKILLADDSVTAQNMGRKILADAGYEVITVNNGSAALKKIAEHRPDVIILDVYMPGYSGLEVCQRLKEAQETSRVPVLLTVGKLEPFKPEEAKRARADAFIVKPFEASELLSALSKLEDKIVPRAETAKPGRFARVTAALEEAKYDKTMAIDEDSGWKNRIGFPHTKTKEEVAAEESDEASIYNPMNNDLRTVVERKSGSKQSSREEAKSESAKVDLGALAPEGLPKDVTPEEIAALAAAAAQVQGTIAEVKAEAEAEQKISEARMSASATEAAPVEVRHQAPQDIKAEASPVAAAAEQKLEEKSEQKSEEKTDTRVEEKLEAAAKKSNEESKDPESSIGSPTPFSPSPADVMAAIAGLETEPATSASANSGNGSWSHSATEPSSQYTADEPVTMAVAASAESGAATSRWTAVAVALAPEESAISLEHEMQKAYAAFAAAESAHAQVAAVAEPPASVLPASLEPASIAPPPLELTPADSAKTANLAVAELAPSEPPSTVTSEPAPVTPPAETAATVNTTFITMANAAADAITEAVKELEAVAASYLAPSSLAPEPSILTSAAETSPAASATVESAPAVASAEPTPETPKLEAVKADPLEVQPDEAKNEELKKEAPEVEAAFSAAVFPPVTTTAETANAVEAKTIEATSPETTSVEARPVETAPIEAMPVETKTEAPVAALPDPTSGSRSSESNFSGSQVSLRGAFASPFSDFAAANYTAAGGIDEMAKKESEAAAAWASFRRIRETGDAKSAAPDAGKEESAPQDEAAMAVAAGAEKAPEEASAPAESDEIASIVDSVLADLRPKIVEEISRKMGKKK
jgi:twitching motility two-component system response regulator PilH